MVKSGWKGLKTVGNGQKQPSSFQINMFSSWKTDNGWKQGLKILKTAEIGWKWMKTFENSCKRLKAAENEWRQQKNIVCQGMCCIKIFTMLSGGV